MKIKTLSIQNFLSIGASGELRLDRKGLVLIQGKNMDDSSASSNGVGKSSIPDALCWALFGETARGVSGDAVVNIKEKKDCWVGVELEIGENHYEVIRYRKHSTHKNQTLVYVRGMEECGEITSTDISKGTEKETQEFIGQIIGCSKDVFMAAIYAGQDTAPDLPRMTDKQLKMLIEEAAGVEKVERALSVARTQLGAAVAVLTAFTHKEESLEIRKGVLISSKTRSQVNFDDYEESRKLNIEESIADARASIAASSEIAKTLLPVGKIESANVRLEEISIEIELHDDRVKDVTDRRKVRDAASRILHGSEIALKSKLDDLRKSMKAIENAPEEMKKPCDECGKPHTEEELEVFVTHLTERKDKCLVAAKDSKAKKDLDELVWKKEEHELEFLTNLVPDVTALLKEKYPLDDLLMKQTLTHAQISIAKTAAQDAAKEAKRCKEATNPQAATIAKYEEDIRATDAAIAVLKTDREEWSTKVDYLKAAVDVFGPAGVRAHILDCSTPLLNERTSDYLSALSDGNITAVWNTLAVSAKGELKEKFNIDVKNDKGAESYIGLSGGEKRKVRLATMLALQDLVATRASNPIDLVIMDEIDDALDSAGLERLMGILERKAREKGTVLVISHNDLNAWIDNVATVTKSGGRSTVSGALSA